MIHDTRYLIKTKRRLACTVDRGGRKNLAYVRWSHVQNHVYEWFIFCVINNASNRKRCFMNKHIRIKRYQLKRSCFRLCIIWKNWSLFYIEHSKQSNLESCFWLYDQETKMTFVHTRVIDNNTVIGIKCSYIVSNARFMDIMYDLCADV